LTLKIWKIGQQDWTRLKIAAIQQFKKGVQTALTTKAKFEDGHRFVKPALGLVDLTVATDVKLKDLLI
jgi:hypothetical protein